MFRWFEQKYIEIITFGVPWLIESWISMIFQIFKCFVLHYYLLDWRKFTTKIRQFSVTESMSAVPIRFNYVLNSNETSFQDSITVFPHFGIYTTPNKPIFPIKSSSISREIQLLKFTSQLELSGWRYWSGKFIFKAKNGFSKVL